MNVVAVADKIVDQAMAYGFAGISANIQNAINDAVAAERERCAQLVNDWAKAYPTSLFGFVADGKHGPTVDSCSAKALRLTLPVIAEEIRGHELHESSDSR